MGLIAPLICDYRKSKTNFRIRMKKTTLESIIGLDINEAQTSKTARNQRRLVAAVPWALAAGFLALIWILFGDLVERGKPVEVESVVTIKRPVEGLLEIGSQGAVSAGDPWDASLLFQASGWIEPDPLPIKATALVNGVVNSVAVLEGEEVEAGQVLAKLISEDFALNLKTAESDLASIEAKAKAHESAIKTGAARIVTLKKRVEAGEKRCFELEDRVERLERVKAGAISEEALTLARLQLETHRAEVDALEVSRGELESDLSMLEAMREEFEANVRRAEVEVSRQNLALSRTEITSPVDGIVLRLLAVPGQKRMLHMDDPDSATVAILYQPDALQARVDVPLEEAAKLNVGQAVRLRLNFLPDKIFKGTVSRIVGEADLQRNTLQAKVRVLDPDRRLRPDMLCRAEFLGSGVSSSATNQNSSKSGTPGRVSVFVPESSVVNRSGSEAQVWALDGSGERVELRSVILRDESRAGFVFATGEVYPGDRVVLNPGSGMEAGDKVKPVEKGVIYE
jgi:multidrug efflux pump subunit AcrA (membrane-fusion protein)